MAFGFPASQTQLIPLNQLTKSDFLQTAIYISKKLNWSLISINEDKLTAITNNVDTWNETILISIEDENTILLKSSSNGNQIYDAGRNKKNIDSFLDFLYDIITDLSSLNLKENTTTEQLNIQEKELISANKTENSTTTGITKFYSFFSIFIPVKNYFITPILINLNILIFITMFFSGVNFNNSKTQDLIDWGANYGPLTTDNEWWRLISACFVHVGFLHMLLNSIALAYIGLLVESYLKKWFLIIYFFCGTIATLISFYWNKDAIITGASGAIFGMFGILLVAILCNLLRKKINTRQIVIIFIFIALNALYALKHGIDETADISGLVSGIIFGIILFLFKNKSRNAFILISSAASIFIVFLFINFKNSHVYIYQTMEYEKRMQEFVDMEKMALEAYNTQAGYFELQSKEDILYKIKDRGIYYWNENLTLLKELDKLYLPQDVHKRNRDMIKYCKLRISVYELTYKKINENTTDYDVELIEMNDEITELMIKLNKNGV